MSILLFLAALTLLTLAYVRLAPSDPARWHVDPLVARDPGPAGVLLRHDTALAPVLALERFDAVARSRGAVVLAGSAETGRITYVARSKWFGFPDYITVAATPSQRGSQLVTLSRLRFGRGDLGVNAARLSDWLKAFEALQ